MAPRPARTPLRPARWLAAAALLASATAHGQPDLNALALDWIRGRFASPVVCHGGGEVARSQRRLVIAAGRRGEIPLGNRITFVGYDVEGAERCTDWTGAEQPDVRGTLKVTLPGMSRPDLAPSEFRRLLRTRGGFDFEVTDGRLQLTAWDEARSRKVIDFKGGTARFRAVRRGTDADRVLADYPSPHKLTLEVEPPGDDVDPDETLRFQLYLYDQR